MLFSFLNSPIYSNNNSLKNFKNKFFTSTKFPTAKRVPRQDDDIPDPTVVYSMALVAHKRGQASCPYPYVLAKSNCQDFSCDLNNGKKNNFVYLCVGKKKLSQLTKEENIINKIIVQVKNNDCGKLKSLTVQDDNVYAFGNNVHICYGYDPNFPPLKDVTIHHKISNKMTIPPNCLYEVVFNKFICTFVEKKSPRKIEFSNLTIRPVKKNFKLLGKPDVITEEKNNNLKGSSNAEVQRKIVASKYFSASWNVQNKFHNKIEGKFVGQNPLILSSFDPNVNFNIEFKAKNDLGEMITSQQSEKFEFNCNSPTRKYYKCRITTDKYSADIPYFLERTVTLWDGKKTTKKINTKFTGILTSSPKMERCCYGIKCDPTVDLLCTKDLKKKTGQCPKLENSLPLFKPNQIFKADPLKLEPDMDLSVIVDIKMVIGRNTFCNNDYEFVKAFNPKDNVRGTDLKYKFETNFSTSHIEYFMCVKKQKLTKIVDYTVINVLKLSKRNDDCGMYLNSEKQSVNEYSEIKICHGFDKSRDLYPISDIVFARETDIKLALTRNYQCDEMKIQKFRMCWKSAKNAVRKISLRNFAFDYNLSKKMQMGPPKIVGEFTSASGNKVITQAKFSNERKSSINKIVELGSAIQFSAGSAYDENPLNPLNQRGIDKFDSIEYTCDGPEPREFRCYASVFTYRIFVPYTADLVYTDYAGKEMVMKTPKKIKGVSDDIMTSGVRINKCCVKNCCTGRETATGPRKWCVTSKGARKDVICTKFQRCFNEFPLKFKKGQYW